MNQISLDPWENLEQQRRHREMLKQMAQSRQAEEGRTSGGKDDHFYNGIMVRIGKELANLGIHIEKHYGMKPEEHISAIGLSSRDGCS